MKPREAELYEYLDSNDNNPNFGMMALEEAVEQRLITEEEAHRILNSAAADLQWDRMLDDAGRNKKLQEFIKSNRWVRRQKFVDFVAIEALEKKKRMLALEQKERELRKAVRHLNFNFWILFVDFETHPQKEVGEAETQLLQPRLQNARQVCCITFYTDRCQSFYPIGCPMLIFRMFLTLKKLSANVSASC